MIAIYTVVGCAFVIALYVFGLLIEGIIYVIEARQRRKVIARRNRKVVVFGDNHPLQGGYPFKKDNP
jgi:uncharacterized membrane protein HdeD (DUF308 family)